MRYRSYSLFWLHFCSGAPLGPAWHDRDMPEWPADMTDAISMAEWLRLSNAEQLAIVGDYVPARSRLVA